jgi:N-acetyltransferase 10
VEGSAPSACKIKRQDLEYMITLFDLKRLESYSKNLVDYHLVMDLVPTISKLFFTPPPNMNLDINLSYT